MGARVARSSGLMHAFAHICLCLDLRFVRYSVTNDGKKRQNSKSKQISIHFSVSLRSIVVLIRWSHCKKNRNEIAINVRFISFEQVTAHAAPPIRQIKSIIFNWPWHDAISVHSAFLRSHTDNNEQQRQEYTIRIDGCNSRKSFSLSISYYYVHASAFAPPHNTLLIFSDAERTCKCDWILA